MTLKYVFMLSLMALAHASVAAEKNPPTAATHESGGKAAFSVGTDRRGGQRATLGVETDHAAGRVTTGSDGSMSVRGRMSPDGRNGPTVGGTFSTDGRGYRSTGVQAGVRDGDTEVSAGMSADNRGNTDIRVEGRSGAVTFGGAADSQGNHQVEMGVTVPF